MPYKNIVFVKLLWKELLFEDKRFLEELNDEQKGLLLMLFLLAGATNNNIPDNENYLKRMLNLRSSGEKIAQNRDFLIDRYRGITRRNGYLKFKNFNKLHNYIGKSSNKKKNSKKEALDKIRIDKIRKEYILLKNLSLKDFDSADYSRTAKAIKTLVSKSGGDDAEVIRGLKWCDNQKWCDWTLETLIRRWADFKAKKNTEPRRQWL